MHGIGSYRNLDGFEIVGELYELSKYLKISFQVITLIVFPIVDISL